MVLLPWIDSTQNFRTTGNTFSKQCSGLIKFFAALVSMRISIRLPFISLTMNGETDVRLKNYRVFPLLNPSRSPLSVPARSPGTFFPPGRLRH